MLGFAGVLIYVYGAWEALLGFIVALIITVLFVSAIQKVVTGSWVGIL
jgi:hypothetical protein